MFGRQVFVEPIDSQRDQRRRNEFLRQFVANQGRRLPFSNLTTLPSLRNDGLMFDLNFILVEDVDRIQPNNLYLRANQENATNRYMLEYIRQMEERYLAMERELTRAKMLASVLPRNTSTHRTSQTDVNWKDCLLKKYGYNFGNTLENQCKRGREYANVSSRRKRYIARRSKDSSQNLQNDIYPIKEPCNQSCQPKTLSSNSTAVCSMHNVAIILPQNSQLPDFSRHNQADSKISSHDPGKCILGNPRKYFGTCEMQKASMEVCQRFDKKHEPETSCHTDFDAKHEDHSQTKPATNTPEFRPIIGPKFNNDISDRKSKVEESTYNCQDVRRKEEAHLGQAWQPGRNHWNNQGRKLTSERARSANDSNNFSRMVQKQKKKVHKKGPTPRSNVHTAYTPMVQSSWNPILDPNGLTIQLMRLAVLLYAPTLMPALNLLIARQNARSIPVPCSEGSNDLLTQIFTILSNQQSVPNLPYVQNTRMDENSQSREATSPNASSYQNSPPVNPTKQFRNHACCEKAAASNQVEKHSIAVNTSLEICNCNNTKKLPGQYDSEISFEQADKKEELVYTWTKQKGNSSETVVQYGKRKGENLKKEEENGNSLIGIDLNVWDRTDINDDFDF